MGQKLLYLRFWSLENQLIMDLQKHLQLTILVLLVDFIHTEFDEICRAALKDTIYPLADIVCLHKLRHIAKVKIPPAP